GTDDSLAEGVGSVHRIVTALAPFRIGAVAPSPESIATVGVVISPIVIWIPGSTPTKSAVPTWHLQFSEPRKTRVRVSPGNDGLSYSSRRRSCRARAHRTFRTNGQRFCRRARDRTRPRYRFPTAPTRSMISI